MHAAPKYTSEKAKKFVILLAAMLLLIGPCSAQRYSLADSVKVRDIITEAFALKISQPNNSLKLAQEALKISKEINWVPGIIRSIRVTGMANAYMGNVKVAFKYYQEALAMSIQVDRKRDEAVMYYTIGSLYGQIGDPGKAYEYMEKALQQHLAINDSIGVADAYSSLGMILNSEQLYEKSNYQFAKAIELFKIQKDTLTTALHMGFMGVNYLEMKKYNEARDQFKQSLAIREIADIYSHFGRYYVEVGKSDSALYYLNLAIPIFERDSGMTNLANAYISVAAIYAQSGKLDIAEQLLTRALVIAQRRSFTELIGLIEKALSELYAKKKDFERAYLHHVLAGKYSDSVLDIATSAKLAESATRFEAKEMEASNKSLHRENELQKLKIQRIRIFTYGSSAMLVLLAISGFLFIRQNRLRIRHERIDLEQKQLRAQMNPHFIFNCLNSIQHFVVAGDVKNANKYLTGFADLMRQTLEHSKAGIVTLRKEIAYLENYLALELMRFENKFSAVISCANDVDQDMIEIPTMIIQPFIENAIRHGLCYLEQAPGVLTVRFYKKDGSIYCEVDDNGIGREQSQKLKERNHIGYESHGMELTRRRLELVSSSSGQDYTISVTDKENAAGEAVGTTVTIKFAMNT